MAASNKTKAELLSENEQLKQTIAELKSLRSNFLKNDDEKRIYYKAIENSPISIVITDADGIIEFVNPFFSKLTGYSFDEAVGKNPNILNSGYHHKKFYKELWGTIKSGKVWQGEFLNKKKSGEEYWESATIGPVFNSKGEITHFVGTKEDITERKKSEEKLWNSEQDYRRLFDEAHDLIIVFEPENEIILDVNRRVCEVYGYKRNELIGMSLKKISKFAPLGEENIKKTIEKGTYKHFNTIHFCKDGTEIQLEINASVVKYKGQQAILSINRDITERKKAEAELQKSEERFRRLVENSPEIIYRFRISPDPGFDFISPAVTKIAGYSPQEYYDNPELGLQIIHPEDRDKLNGFLKGIVPKNPHQVRWIRRDGKIIWTEDSFTPIYNEKGEIIAIEGIAREITAQKEAEEALKEAYDIINKSPAIPFLWKNEEGWPVEYVSENVVGLFEYTAEEFMSGNVSYSKLIHPDDLERVRNEVTRYSSNEDTSRFSHKPYRIVTKSGKIKWVEDKTYIRRDENNQITHFQGIVEDITTRRISELAHLESEEKFSKTFNSSPNPMIISEIESGKVIEVNKSFENMIKYSKHEIVGESVLELNLWANSDDRNNYIKKIKEEKSVSNIEIKIRTKFGDIRDSLISGEIITIQGRPYLLTSGRDITERKLAEEALRKNEEKLRNIIEHSTNLFYSHTPNHVLTYVSPQSKRYFGYEPEEAMVKWMQLISDNPINKKGIETTVKAIETGKPQPPYELELKKKDGSLAWVEVHEAPVVKNGKTTAIVGALTDITERKKVEEELHLKNIVFNSSIAANSIADSEGIISHANPSFLKMWGFDDEKDVIGKPISYFFENEEDTLPVMASLNENGAWEGEFSARKKDGSTFISRGLATVVINKEGKLIGYQSANLDVTMRKYAERALRESERKLSTIIDNIPGMTYRCLMDDFWTMKFISKGCKEITGYSQLELLDNKKLSYEDLIFPDDKEKVRAEVFKTLNTQNQFELEYRIIRKDGSVRWMWERGVQINEKINGVPLLEGIIEDITEKKLAQEALIESEAKWRSLTENSPDIITLVDSQENIQFINRTKPGEDKCDLVGKSAIETIPEEYKDAARKCFKYVLDTGRTDSYNTIYYTETGEELFYQVLVGPVFKEDEIVGVVSSARNITPQKVAEKRIRESHARLRNLAERLQMIREEERAAVSREIHDDLGQVLTALKMDISSMQRKGGLDQNELNLRTDKMLELVNSSIQTVKRIATELRPGILDDLGLFPAIEWQAEEFQNRTKINCKLKIEGEMEFIDDEVSIAIFRVFQETLTNITRHSHASQANVTLVSSDKELMLEVEDNGRGISREQMYGPRSLGILGMRERVHILRGEFEISGGEGKGTRVLVKIPLRKSTVL